MCKLKFLWNVYIQLGTFITGDAITGMIGQVTEIAGRAKQAFIVGQGLSPEGAKLLGKKLACMTIGDLEGLLELKNIDPFKVAELMGHLRDLAKALVRRKSYHSVMHELSVWEQKFKRLQKIYKSFSFFYHSIQNSSPRYSVIQITSSKVLIWS